MQTLDLSLFWRQKIFTYHVKIHIHIKFQKSFLIIFT